MSYMALYMINKDGDAICYEEYANSHGYDPYIWTALCHKHNIGTWFVDENANKLEQLAANPKVPWFERTVLETTFDYAIIRKEDIPKVVSALEKFEEAYHNEGHVNHIPAVISALQKLANENIIGVCFYPTSTIDNPWVLYNGKEDLSVPYNIFKGTKHHFVPCYLEE